MSVLGDALTRLPDVDPTDDDLDLNAWADRNDIDSRFDRGEYDDIEVPVAQNIAQADWQLRKLARIRQRAAENAQLVADAVARYRAWLEQENGKLARQAAFYEEALAAFHRSLLDDDPKRKTVSLPTGVLKARKHPDRWDVDDDVFVAWAKDNAPELVRVKEEPAKSELKKFAITAVHADDDGLESIVATDRTSGERIPGVTITAGDVAFTVDTEVRS